MNVCPYCSEHSFPVAEALLLSTEQWPYAGQAPKLIDIYIFKAAAALFDMQYLKQH